MDGAQPARGGAAIGAEPPDDADVPWGRYTYAVDGLATGCYLEGAAADAPGKRRLRFRVELPARCFVMSVALKLTDGAPLYDATVERTLNNADFDVVHDGAREPDPAAAKPPPGAEGDADAADADADTENEKDGGDGDGEGGAEGGGGGGADGGADADADADADGDGDEGGDRARRKKRGQQQARSAAERAAKRDSSDPMRKTIEVRRAADNLRLVLTDLDDGELALLRKAASGAVDAGAGADAAAHDGSVRVLAVSVVGYTRGQTPPSKGLKLLLGVSTRLLAGGTLADRAEVDGLLGLAFLGSRRYRQAAELLCRAADLCQRVANEDAKLGFAAEGTELWAAQLHLLAAHAFFEHVPLSNDGVASLLRVAAAGVEHNRAESARSSFGSAPRSSSSPRDVRDASNEFLDLRTELLSSIDPLMSMLILFLAESKSLAARMSSARMIEFVAEQLGCAISPYMSRMLNCVLRSYQECKPFVPRDRPAANSFSYDSMEDCYERLIDMCCKMLPITEHTVVQNLFNHTIVPIFQKAFKESDYLSYEEGVEETCDELLCTAIAQTLRVSYLVLTILEGDAHVPSSFVSRILNMLISENGVRRTPTLLRRTALHTWDAVSRSLTLGACGMSVTDFKEFLVVQKEYIGRLVVQMERPGFEYEETEDSEHGIEVFKEDVLAPRGDKVLNAVLAKREERTVVVDRFTLKRVLDLVQKSCESLQSSGDENAMVTSAYCVFDLQNALASAAADLLMSSLVDVSYHAACASGNGSESRNNHLESGSLQTHLRHSCAVLEDLLECFWCTVSLLPANMAAEAERSSPVRHVLAWCADRMKYSAPPSGMLKLLTSVCKSLAHDLNKSMHVQKQTPSSDGEATFMQLYRSHLTWVAQATTEESLELSDTLAEIAASDFMAGDILRTVDALSDQTEELGARADASLDRFASLVADKSPRSADLALASLKKLASESSDKQQRIFKDFPSSSGSGSFSRRIRLGTGASGSENPLMRSFYLHVVLVSCFDKFDALSRLSARKVGPSFVSEQLDSFVEHAALLVRALNSAARDRLHREYMSTSLSDIFGSCLTMQDHVDGRVRLAGFEIFSGALDVLFLAQKQATQQSSSATVGGSDAVVSQVLGTAGAIAAGQNAGTVGAGGVGSIITELGNSDVEGDPAVSLVSPVASPSAVNGMASGSINGGAGSGVGAPGSCVSVSGEGEAAERAQASDASTRETDDINALFLAGGPRVFRADSTAVSHLRFEDSAWQMLCAFMTHSLGVGKYVDFVVQRACLEYLKGCLLNALRGHSSGASVLSLKHVEEIWDSVMRLVGSPWRTLNALSFWVSCAVVNVGFYVTVTSKGRQSKIRASQLEDFALNRLFPAADKFLRGGTRETRLWGARLLEVYLRARDMNPMAYEFSPAPQARILRQLDSLCHDWSEEVRDLSKLLRDIYIDSSVNAKGAKSSSGSTQSFTQSSLSAMKRQLYRDSAGSESSESVTGASKVQLWFPPLPKSTTAAEAEVYGRTLEAFANTEVAGGEEEEEEEEEEQEAYYDDEEYDEDDQYEGEEVEADDTAAEQYEVDAEEDETEDASAADEDITEPLKPDDQDSSDSDDSDEPTSEVSDEPVTTENTGEKSPSGPNADVPDIKASLVTSESPKHPSEDEVPEAGSEDPSNDSESDDDDEDYEFAGLGKKTKEATEEGAPISDAVADDKLKKDQSSLRENVASPVEEPKPKPASRSDSGPDVDEADEDVVTVTNNADPLADMQSSAPPSSRPAPLGLDLEEKMPGSRLRRRGSFTGVSRSPSSTGPLSGEGEGAPRLGRRRSTDTSGGEMGPGGEDYSSERRPVGEAPSPVSVARRKALFKLPMVASMMDMDGKPDGQQASATADGPQMRRKSERESGGGSSFVSPRPRRMQSGTLHTGDDDQSGNVGLQKERSRASVDGAGGSFQSSSDEAGSGGRPKPRRLPRAPAFVKGDARLPRPATNPRLSSDSSNNPPGARPKVPRTKGSRSLKLPNTGGSEPDRKADRPHRVGRRDVKIALDDDGLGLDDDDLFGEFDPTHVEDEPGPVSNNTTRSASSKGTQAGRRELSDDDEMPPAAASTPKRRSSQRILDSVEYFSRKNLEDS